MKIQKLSIQPSSTIFIHGLKRCGSLISMADDKGNTGWGEMAPLSKWSWETHEDALVQLKKKTSEILAIDWKRETCFEELARLDFLPSVSFGVESALLSILDPIDGGYIPESALLMGNAQEILEQAQQRHSEGYTSAKLKVNNLSFAEAASVIHQLKDKFYLRIDVNRAWKTSESLHFFAQFPLDTFDYVEEPFNNPFELAQFHHPLAIDESYPNDLTLDELRSFPALKALVYKPTIQGGILGCLHLVEWTKEHNIQLVLSSSFESELGLTCIVSMAHRLGLRHPIGIGTRHFLIEKVGISRE